MTRIQVYGASDDLIEVVGDITEEFDGGDHNAAQFLAFSDGTVLRIKFDDNGTWRITPVSRGTATLAIDVVDEADDLASDRAQLDGEIAWVVHGHASARRIGAPR